MLDVGTEVVIVSLSFSVSQHLKQNLEHNYKRRVGQQVVAQSSTLPSDNEGLLWVIPTQRVAKGYIMTYLHISTKSYK